MSRPLFDFDTGVISRAVASVAGAIKRVTSETISKHFREQINLKKKKKTHQKTLQYADQMAFWTTPEMIRWEKQKKKTRSPQWASEMVC